MKTHLHHLLRPAALLVASALLAGGANADPGAPALPVRAHAHNDYEHARPLFDALDHGFLSIEADIYLVDGQLLVAHDRDKVQPARTLAALYLDPLRERIRQNGGHVHPDGPPIILLIDVKSEAGATYAVLHEMLARYAGMLTTYRGARIEPGAVTAIVSGNRARAVMAAQAVRYAALDGRIDDLTTDAPATLIPLVSDNWAKVFSWRGDIPMPAAERERLREFVRLAHARGRLLRFWNNPERPEVWRELRAAGVDLIGTDDLPRLRDFLRTPPGG